MATEVFKCFDLENVVEQLTTGMVDSVFWWTSIDTS